jgi:hypothetical protein
MSYSPVGLAPTIRIANSSQPIGLRGRRAASRTPTNVAGIAAAPMDSDSTTGPPVPGVCTSASSTTVDATTPSTTRPSRTAATWAIRARLTNRLMRPLQAASVPGTLRLLARLPE